ncbi:hypothetical protein BX667DRAFT_522517 [Coemansia mojavensis]|nr:hypothetical protein BX667DRAFT_523908 [Coemansia mojavensis]KAI9480029.1 hypothetical protein BX667DRAFT_522517 [Coemansia mojavensis]
MDATLEITTNKALLVITDLEPDDMIGIKMLWLCQSKLASIGYTTIWVVVCGNADQEKCSWLLNNIPSALWSDMECLYFLGNIKKMVDANSFANWKEFVPKQNKHSIDALVLAPADDLLPVFNHKKFLLENIFNQGGKSPTTGRATFNWADMKITREMMRQIAHFDCNYYLLCSEFIKSGDSGYPGGSIHGDNSYKLHPAIIKDNSFKDVIAKWNDQAKMNPKLPANVKALLNKPYQFTPADIFVVYAFLFHCGVWKDAEIFWSDYSNIEISDDGHIIVVEQSVVQKVGQQQDLPLPQGWDQLLGRHLFDHWTFPDDQAMPDDP